MRLTPVASRRALLFCRLDNKHDSYIVPAEKHGGLDEFDRCH